MRVTIVLGLLCCSCGADPEVRREYYPVFPDASPSPEVVSVECPAQPTCSEIVSRLYMAGYLKKKHHKTPESLCAELTP